MTVICYLEKEIYLEIYSKIYNCRAIHHCVTAACFKYLYD